MFFTVQYADQHYCWCCTILHGYSCAECNWVLAFIYAKLMAHGKHPSIPLTAGLSVRTVALGKRETKKTGGLFGGIQERDCSRERERERGAAPASCLSSMWLYSQWLATLAALVQIDVFWDVHVVKTAVRWLKFKFTSAVQPRLRPCKSHAQLHTPAGFV